MRSTATAIVFLVCTILTATEASPVILGLAPPTRKVFRSSPVRELPLEGVQLRGAGGEHVSAQLVFTAGPQVPASVNVRGVIPLLGPAGASLASSQVTLLRVAYVPDPDGAAARDWSTVRWDPELLNPELDHYPDPLPPWTGPVTIPAGENQPLWIKVSIPRYCPPGTYRGALRLELDGGPRLLPLHVQVWPFTLPLTPGLRTAVGNYPSAAVLEGMEPRSDAEAELIQAYYEFLVSRRLSPYALPGALSNPRSCACCGTWETCRWAGVRTAPGLAAARDPRVTSFVASPEDIPYLTDHGLLHKALLYPVDEPVDEEAFESMRRLTAEIHALNPFAPIVTPFYRYPGFVEASPVELMAGMTTVWCPITSLYHQRPDLREQLAARRELGDEIWTYVCVGPRERYCNLFIHQEGIRHRLLAWQVRQAGIEGLLYWSVQWWQRVNPWESMATWDDHTAFGDGSLIYPGAPAGVPGPVSSQRLECLLLGLQDYEYFTLLARVAGEAAVQAAIAQLVTDWVTYSLDEGKLEQVRTRIGERLAAAAARRAAPTS